MRRGTNASKSHLVDMKAIHDRVKNRYTIVKDGKTITLVPLTPKQVYDDQIKLKS